MEQVDKILKKVKESKPDPNIDKFTDDKSKFRYILVTKITRTICFLWTVYWLPEITMKFIGIIDLIMGGLF